MTKQYKHIKLPSEFSLKEENFTTNRKNRLIEELPPFDIDIQKQTLQTSMGNVNNYYDNISNKLIFHEDKKKKDLKVKFFGSVDSKFIERYGVNVFKKEYGDNFYI